jgi:hypothetical protein
MSKFLIGVATAALWFVLSHAANATPGSGVDIQTPQAGVQIGR